MESMKFQPKLVKVHNVFAIAIPIAHPQHVGIDEIFYEITQSLVKNVYGQDLFKTMTTDIHSRQDDHLSSDKSGCC